jgi:hypothetical protein
MNPNIVIPDFDAIPLPAPVWLLKALLLLTLFLHLVAMNMLFGGTLTALFSGRKFRKNGDPNHGRLYKEMVSYLPTLVAATVTLGVAPLLFVQVLYGHLVYSSSVAMGWFWWFVWILAIVAYYCLYYLKFKAAEDAPAHKWVLWVAAGALTWISFTLSNNFNLAQQPERFSAMILKDPRGWWLNLSDPTTFPRWLHIMLGAVAVAGIWLMWLGRLEHRKDPSYASHKLTLGNQLFAFPTMANIIIGFVLMMTFPREIMLRLMGQGFLGTALWLIGMGLAIWALPIFKRAVTEPQSAALPLGTLLMTISVLCMVMLRDVVRSDYLKPYFTLDLPQVQTQWGPIVMFLISFVVGLFFLYWLVNAYLRQKKNS